MVHVNLNLIPNILRFGFSFIFLSILCSELSNRSSTKRKTFGWFRIFVVSRCSEKVLQFKHVLFLFDDQELLSIFSTSE